MVAVPGGHAGVLADLIQPGARSGVLDACQELAARERCDPQRVMCLQQERTIVNLSRDVQEPLTDFLGIVVMPVALGVEPQSPKRREQLPRRTDAVAQLLSTLVCLLGRRGAETLACQQERPERDVERDLLLRPLARIRKPRE